MAKVIGALLPCVVFFFFGALIGRLWAIEQHTLGMLFWASLGVYSVFLVVRNNRTLWGKSKS